MNLFYKGKNRGFTLIELLVTIAIIGILSSTITFSVNLARAKARDAIRKQTLINLRNAIEVYYTQNGSYPSTGGVFYSSDADDNHISGAPGPGVSNNGGNWIPGLVSSGAIAELPRDPRGDLSGLVGCAGVNNWKRAYQYKSDGRSYKLIAHCSPETALDVVSGLNDPLRTRMGTTVTQCQNDTATGTINLWAWSVWNDSTARCW